MSILARYPDDPIYRDQVVSQVKSYVANVTQAQAGLSKAASDQLTTIALSADDRSNAPTSLQDLLATAPARQSWAMIDPEQQRGMLSLLEHNAKEAAGGFQKSDAKVVNGLFDRIHASDSDPNKITSPEQLVPFFSKGISKTDYDWLRGELDKTRTPEGSAFQKDVQQVRSYGQTMLMRSFVGNIQPDVAAEAAYRFNFELDKRIDAYRKAGKDPRELFNPASKDYVLNPAYVGSFMPNSQQAVANAAKTAPAAAPSTKGLPTVKSDAEFNQLPSGAKFVAPDGSIRTKP